MRLNSRTGTEGSPASSINRNKPLHSGIRAFVCTVMRVGRQIIDGYGPHTVVQLAERRFLAGELTLSCARPAVDG